MRDCERANIAFNGTIADELNQMAAQIDGRLFLFAYYEPKQCYSGDGAHCRFNTAIVNLYGLIWDCSPFLRGQLLTTREINMGAKDRLIVPYLGGNPQAKDVAITQQFQDLATVVECIRSCYCHNNSSQFYLNEKKLEFQKKWLSSHTGCNFDKGPETEEEWQKALDDLLQESTTLVDNLKRCLNYVKNSRSRTFIVDTWIRNGILYWYYKNRDILYNELVLKYMSRFNHGDEPQRISRYEINKWVTQMDRPSAGDVNRVFEGWFSRQAQNDLLSLWDSNTPLLPSDVICTLISSVDQLPPPQAVSFINESSISLFDF